ncbi:MAG TPA: Fur family transcriptional regulator [Spirochaetota bacterium]|nr:Fur family transcriptional regulator [Spirochaetota bacterium]
MNKNICLEELIKTNNKEYSFRLTLKRKTIFDIIRKMPGHSSAEEILDETRKYGNKIGIATIYRFLNLMNRKGFISSMSGNDGITRYSISLTRKTHHHLICKACGKIIDIADNYLIETIKKNNPGFEIPDQSISFYGICPECRKSSNTNGDNNVQHRN